MGYGTEGMRQNWIRFELDLAGGRHVASREKDVKVRGEWRQSAQSLFPIYRGNRDINEGRLGNYKHD